MDEEEYNMKILNIKLINFASIMACRHRKEVSYDFTDNTKTIYQICGPNRSGKTVLLQQLHPFSSINLSGDERSDMQLILPKEIGIKEITYDVDGEIYIITHTYKPTPSGKSHTVISSLMHNGQELNPSGGVNTFNTMIEKLFGLNKYIFQFTINGTQLLSLSTMSSTQRKSILYKASGVDIYDKIHKMSTDDHRYTNKLITSLNNSKEYILAKYGSYEMLQKILSDKNHEVDAITSIITEKHSRMDALSGKISVIQEQNPTVELAEKNRIMELVQQITSQLGQYDDSTYIKLADDQILLNNELSDMKSKLYQINKDYDDLASKKNDITSTMMKNRRAKEDYDNMCDTAKSLESQIKSIVPSMEVTASSEYYNNTINLSQTINSMCKEVSSILNDTLMDILCDLIIKRVDVSAFIMKQSSMLMDSEKEKNAILRFRELMLNVEGDYPDEDRCNHNCIYRNFHNKFNNYMKASQSVSSNNLSLNDLENIDHAWKNIIPIKRLINTEFPKEISEMFTIENIMINIKSNKYGINTDRLYKLYQDAINNEQRLKLISQLDNINKTISSMKELIMSDDNNVDDVINSINTKLSVLSNERTAVLSKIDEINNKLQINDNQRSLISQIKHVNVGNTQQRINQLTLMIQQLTQYQNQYQELSFEYNELLRKQSTLQNELEVIKNADMQCKRTLEELLTHKSNDQKYKIISDATSSTKGYPVIMIKNIIDESIKISNHLLNIIYDGSVKLLNPEISETSFDIPFTHDLVQSNDIRYGSQSESTIFSLVLSLALSSQLSNYNVILIDEIDAYLDHEFKDRFITMLDEVSKILKIDQLFLISHNVNTDQFEQILHKVSLI